MKGLAFENKINFIPHEALVVNDRPGILHNAASFF